MSADRIVHMANQIAAFFKSRTEPEAVLGTQDHIVKFWDPRMRAQLMAHLDAGGAGLSAIARQAAEQIKAALEARRTESHPTDLRHPASRGAVVRDP